MDSIAFLIDLRVAEAFVAAFFPLLNETEDAVIAVVDLESGGVAGGDLCSGDVGASVFFRDARLRCFAGSFSLHFPGGEVAETIRYRQRGIHGYFDAF